MKPTPAEYLAALFVLIIFNLAVAVPLIRSQYGAQQIPFTVCVVAWFLATGWLTIRYLPDLPRNNP